jgi:hypothetical protein
MAMHNSPDKLLADLRESGEALSVLSGCAYVI